MLETMDIHDWLNLAPNNETEAKVKKWFKKFFKLNIFKEKLQQEVEATRPTVEYHGKRYICTGASQLGDVWLKTEDSKAFYDLRVEVKDLSNWEVPNGDN